MSEIRTHTKSFFLRTLEFLRNISIVVLTFYFSYLLWKWHWVAAVIGIIPVFILVNNAIRLLTFPLYSLARDNKFSRETTDVMEEIQ